MKLIRVNLHVQRIVVVKTVVCVGLVAAHFFPGHTGIVIAVASNMVWLFLT